MCPSTRYREQMVAAGVLLERGGKEEAKRAEDETRLEKTILYQDLLSQYCKAAALMLIAVVHLLKINDLLVATRVLEEHADSIPPPSLNMTFDEKRTRYAFATLLHTMHEYKSNTWMLVALMCASLAMLAVLIVPPPKWMTNKMMIAIRVFDFLCTLSFPVMFINQLNLVYRLAARAVAGVEAAALLASPDEMMNELHCSIVKREKLPLCASSILSSVFPVWLLEYLIILCIITAAYIALAYAIQYCLRHWFPHRQVLHPLKPIKDDDDDCEYH